MDIMQVAAIGITAVFLSLVVKRDMPVFSSFIELSAGLVIFFYTIDGLGSVIEVLSKMAEESGISKTYMTLVMKISATAYITQFVCDICSDAGEKAVANKIDMAGKIIVAVISSPVILSLMEAILKFL